MGCQLDNMVFVQCMTFNHVNYIEDAMKGFVMQKTDFPYMALVVDDASTDGEPEVIKSFLDKEFDMVSAAWNETDDYVRVVAKHKTNENCTFVVVFLKYNHYSIGKLKQPYYIDWKENAKYIALCEGDDYWTDPLKLQKQVDILEKDETLMACVTNCSVVDEKGKTIKEIRGGVVKDDVDGRYDLRQFFGYSHQYPTLSVVYRNSHPKEVGEKTKIMSNPYLGDWTLWIALHCFGDFYFLNEVTCAYRVNPTSLTHSNTNKRRIGMAKENFRLLPAVASVLPDGYEDIQKDLRENTAWIWWDLGHAYFKSHKYLNAMWCLFRCGIKNPSFLFKTMIEK